MDLFLTTVIGLAITLGLVALGGLFSERAGIINIGLEGMMTSGGLIWAICGTQMKAWGNETQILGFFLAGIIGSMIAMLHGLVSISLQGNQIISGTAINMLSIGLALFIINAFDIGGRPNQIVSGYVVFGFARSGIWSQISVLLIPVILIFIFSWWTLRNTKWGLRLRTVGENPIAAEAAGINVIALRYQALVISGFLAGLGGGFFVQYLSGSFYGSAQGFGFLALAILIFGQWRVYFVGFATIIFSSLTVFALIGQVQFNIWWLNKIPREFMQTVPFVASLVIMAVTAKTMASPKSLGKPYAKSKKSKT